ncbi:MAG: prepilin peptidase [Nanoarchaeota archaeon]
MAEILINFLVILGIIGLIIATLNDLKKREVPDWLNFSLIVIALASRLLYSLTAGNLSFILYGLIYFGIFLVLAYAFYYARIFAGGDSKLLMAMGAVFALFSG